MKARCGNRRAKDFATYGARGIKVCSRWGLFANFLADMGEKPVGLTLGRINNNGNYCKSNCRWETNAQQARNKITSRMITFGKSTRTVTEWSRLTGIQQPTLHYRLFRLGWTVEQALTKPSRQT